jgi:hypothetical protein
MLRSKQKPFEEILGYLEGESRVFVLGCDGCAQASGTGGPVQIAEMKEKPRPKVRRSRRDVISFLYEKADQITVTPRPEVMDAELSWS